jgi:hypothetical protein
MSRKNLLITNMSGATMTSINQTYIDDIRGKITGTEVTENSKEFVNKELRLQHALVGKTMGGADTVEEVEAVLKSLDRDTLEGVQKAIQAMKSEMDKETPESFQPIQVREAEQKNADQESEEASGSTGSAKESAIEVMKKQEPSDPIKNLSAWYKETFNDSLRITSVSTTDGTINIEDYANWGSGNLIGKTGGTNQARLEANKEKLEEIGLEVVPEDKTDSEKGAGVVTLKFKDEYTNNPEMRAQRALADLKTSQNRLLVEPDHESYKVLSVLRASGNEEVDFRIRSAESLLQLKDQTNQQQLARMEEIGQLVSKHDFKIVESDGRGVVTLRYTGGQS